MHMNVLWLSIKYDYKNQKNDKMIIFFFNCI